MMPSIFTRFVRSFDPQGSGPTDAQVEEVLEQLRGILIRELKRRGLWHRSPRYLGVLGYPVWTPEAVDELVPEAFLDSFHLRIRSLRAQIHLKESIDGLVWRNVRHLLSELQRRNDRVGYRVFELLRRAVRRLLETGELDLSQGHPAVDLATELTFPTATGDLLLTPEELVTPLALWTDDLLPDLILARGRGVPKIQRQLEAHILSLASLQRSGFRFGDLVDPLRQQVRQRWLALHQPDAAELGMEEREGETPVRVMLTRPDVGDGQGEALEQIVDCVARQLDRRQLRGDRDADPLRRLFSCLHISALEDEPAPSQRKLATFLRVSRKRMPHLLRELQEVVEHCLGDQDSVSGR